MAGGIANAICVCLQVCVPIPECIGCAWSDGIDSCMTCFPHVCRLCASRSLIRYTRLVFVMVMCCICHVLKQSDTHLASFFFVTGFLAHAVTARFSENGSMSICGLISAVASFALRFVSRADQHRFSYDTRTVCAHRLCCGFAPLRDPRMVNCLCSWLGCGFVVALLLGKCGVVDPRL